MTAAGVTVAVVFTLALGAPLGAPAEPTKRVIALAPPDIRWVTPPYYTDGRQRAYLRGDSAKGGDWIDRVRIPGGSRGDRFDEAKLKAYPAGSFIVIPADVPHFLATKEGPVIVQVSGHGVFRTNYVEVS